jgi:hypothetical protein
VFHPVSLRSFREKRAGFARIQRGGASDTVARSQVQHQSRILFHLADEEVV